MEELGREIGEISHHEDNERLDDTHLVSVTRDIGGDEPVNDPDDGGPDSDDDKRPNPGEYVDREDILAPDLAVGLEHMIQDLRGRERRRVKR